MPGHRQSIRRRDHDYRSSAIYLITVCTHERAPLLGDLRNGIVHLSPFGQCVHDCWSAIPEHFPHVSLDAFVVMPDHIHGIIVMTSASDTRTPPRATHASPLPAGSLGAVVGSFKSAATKLINRMRNTPGAVVWQRNYYDQIVTDLPAARDYVRQNPTIPRPRDR